MVSTYYAKNREKLLERAKKYYRDKKKIIMGIPINYKKHKNNGVTIDKIIVLFE
jgi:hypothetical protein